MSFNGSGTYVPPSGQPVAAGTVIQSSTFNTLVTDIGNTFNNVLPRDGQAAMAAQLKLIDGTSSVPGIAFNSEASTGMFRPTTGTLALVASGVENLRINSSGRVLIGTTSDDGTNKLQVNGPVKVSGALNATGAATFASTLNVSGNVTAPSFIGSLSGNVSGNLTGNVTGNLTGNVTGNAGGTAANITGVAAVSNGGTGANTATAALTNLGAAPISAPSFTGNVSVSGGNLYLTGQSMLGGATATYASYASSMTINYPGSGSMFGIALKPAISTSDTNALTFLTSSSTYASATPVGAIQHRASDAGMNLSGSWTYQGSAILTQASKDASGSYVGLTGYNINTKNTAGTVLSQITNSNTVARTYTLPDKNGTVAMTSDLGSLVYRDYRTANATLVKADGAKWLSLTGSFTQTFDTPANLGAGWFAYITNAGTGEIIIPSSDGVTNWKMYAKETRLFVSDGTNLTSMVINSFNLTLTATTNFIKPPGYQHFGLELIGAGGGGSYGGSASGGGGGGAFVFGRLPEPSVPSTVSVTVGAGGVGGVATGQSTGSNGTAGGSTSFGGLLTAFGGGGGIYFYNGQYGGGGGGAQGTGATIASAVNASAAGGLPSIAVFGGGTGGSLYSGGTTVLPGASTYGGGGGSTQGETGGGSLFGGGGGAGAILFGSKRPTGGSSGYSGTGGGITPASSTTAAAGATGGAGAYLCGGGAGSSNSVSSGAGNGADGGPGGVGGGGGGGGTYANQGGTGGNGGAGGRGEAKIWGII
jgi:hypothetical protein